MKKVKMKNVENSRKWAQMKKNKENEETLRKIKKIMKTEE